MSLILNKLFYFIVDFKFYLLLILLITLIFLVLLIRLHTRLALLLSSVVCSLLAIFTFGEIYFRYIYDQSDGLGFLKVNQKWHQRHVVFNNYFKRSDNFEPQKPPGEIRLAVMGDSISFGGGIEDPQNRFSNLLERKLRADGLNVSIYNLGISGTGTQEQIQDFNNLRHLNFDLLIWQYFFNDANPQTDNLGTKIIMDNQNKFTPPPLINWLTDHSYFADWLYWRLSSKYDQTFTDLANADLKSYQDPALFSQHQQDIQSFLNQLHRQRLPVVVIIFPYLYPTSQPQARLEAYQKTYQIFQSADADAVIQLAPYLKHYSYSQITASRFDSHPNELAHQIAADPLYQAIKPLLP